MNEITNKITVEDVLAFIDSSKNNEELLLLKSKVDNFFNINSNDKKKSSIEKLIDSVPFMIGQWDKHLFNIHANKTYIEYFGKSAEIIKGMHIKEVLGESLFIANLPYIEKVLKGEFVSFEREITLADGEIRHTLASYIPHIIDGSIEGFIATVSDVTEIKILSKSLIEQKQFFSEILNSMHEAFVIQDKDANIIFYNSPAAKILGMSNDQILGKTSLDPGWQAIRADGSSFPRDEHPAMYTIRTGLAQTNVTMGIRTTGKETHWINVNSVPFLGSFGNQKACVLVTFDYVTVQYQKSKLIAGVIENSPDMIYQFKLTKNGEMSFPFSSPKVFEICDLTPEEFESDTSILLKLVIEEDRANLFNLIAKSAEKISLFEWKGRLRTNKGVTKWVYAKSHPRKDHDGSITWDGILTDITSEVNLQDQLVLERARAVHTAKLASLGELSASVAHEINNPLAIIVGLSSQLKKHISDPQKFDHKVSEISKSVDRIAKIVNGLKRFSRYDEKVPKGSFDIQSIISNSTTYFDIKTRQDYINLKFDIQSNATIFCDPLEIEQVILNLVNNAIDAVKNLKDRWVNVLVSEDNGELSLRVIDAGAGIEATIVEKIFEPFITTKELGRGTGLGLSISRGIIEAHGGSLRLVKEHPNTCFELRLPLELK